MTSIRKNKKGVVMTELLASIVIMGIVSVSLVSLTFFAFNAYNITMRSGRQSEATLLITERIIDEISDWNAANIESSTADSVTFQRFVYFEDNADGTTVKYTLPKDSPDRLTLQIIRSGSNAGNIRFTFQSGDGRISNYTQLVDLEKYTLDLNNTRFETQALSTVTASGVTTTRSYLVKVFITTSSPYVIEIPLSFPVLVNIPD